MSRRPRAGSRVVTTISKRQPDEAAREARFFLVGYGCTRASQLGRWRPRVEAAVTAEDLSVAQSCPATEIRITYPSWSRRATWAHPRWWSLTRSLAPSHGPTKDPVGHAKDGKPVMLSDLCVAERSTGGHGLRQQEMFKREYSKIFEGDEHWKTMSAPQARSSGTPSPLMLRSPVLRGLRPAP